MIWFIKEKRTACEYPLHSKCYSILVNGASLADGAAAQVRAISSALYYLLVIS